MFVKTGFLRKITPVIIIFLACPYNDMLRYSFYTTIAKQLLLILKRLIMALTRGWPDMTFGPVYLYSAPLMSPPELKIQSFDDTDVYNLHPFGGDLQQFCLDNLDVFDGHGHGFLDGGCYALALALKGYIENGGGQAELYSIGRPSIIDHLVVRVKIDGVALYLDGDGLSTERDLMEKMQLLEDIAAPVIRPFDASLYARNDRVIPSYEEAGVPVELQKRLQRTLGEFDMARLGLNWSEGDSAQPSM